MACCTHGHRAGSRADVCPDCELPVLTRNHFFTGKLMAARDFVDEQAFFLGKDRRHVQYLHGSGTACGLKVIPHPVDNCRDRWLVVEPGYAIDCCGRELFVQQPEYVDYRALFDAWFTQTHPGEQYDEAGYLLRLCIRYRECATEEVPVLFDAGCDDDRCEPNRLLESYEFHLIVGGDRTPLSPPAIGLSWPSSLPYADPTVVRRDDTLHRVYVATGGAAPLLHALDSANHFSVGGRSLTTPAVDMVVTANGEKAWLARLDGADAIVEELDLTQPTLPTVHSETVAGAGAGPVRLAVAPDGGRAYVLDGPGGKVLAVPPNGPAAAFAADLGGATDLAVSKDGAHLFVAHGGHDLAVLDTNNPAAAATTLSVGASGDAKLVVRTGASPDERIVAAVTDGATHVLRLTPVAGGTVQEATLPDETAALVASADGQWVFAIQRDAAGKASVLPVDIGRLALGHTDAVGPATPLGDAPVAAAIDSATTVLYVALAGDDTPANPGGVAMVAITADACNDLWASAIEGCPACGDGDECLVLATIVGWHPGDRVEESAIDNLTDRRLLPSTSLIAEVVQCLLERGGGGGGERGPRGPEGPQGPAGQNGTNGTNGAPGANGANGLPGSNGHDGIGLNPALPHIVAISWPHNGVIAPEGRVIPPEGEHDPGVEMDVRKLLIAFDPKHPVRAETIHEHSIQVLYAREDGEGRDLGEVRTRCWCQLEGFITGIDLVGGCDDGIQGVGQRSSTGPVTGALFQLDEREPRPLPPGRYRVLVHGDHIVGEEKIALADGSVVHPCLDANHLAPGILGPGGFSIVPGLDRRCPTGDWVEGGTFLSWFTIREG